MVRHDLFDPITPRRYSSLIAPALSREPIWRALVHVFTDCFRVICLLESKPGAGPEDLPGSRLECRWCSPSFELDALISRLKEHICMFRLLAREIWECSLAELLLWFYPELQVAR